MSDPVSIFDIIQVVAAISSAFAAYFAFKQGKLMKAQLDTDRYLRQNEKSIELAKMFAEEIVPQSSYINSMVHCSNSFKEIANIISRTETSRFNSDEYKEIVGEHPSETLNKIKKELTSIDSYKSVINAASQLKLTKPDVGFQRRVHICRTDKHQETSDTNHVTKSKKNKKSKKPATNTETDGHPSSESSQHREDELFLAYMEFAHVENSLLNKLEHFCMALNSEVADDAVLYPSLHQVFFSIVSSLYVFICNANDGNPTDRYFTHIIKVYNKWQKIHISEKQLMKAAEDEIGATYEKKKEELLK